MKGMLLAAGLSKKLGNDSIGVASDNLFEMMSRQYRKQQTNSEFLQATPGAPAATGATNSIANPRRPGSTGY